MSIFSPNTKDELKTAVDLYCDNELVALKQYGIINTWDTSKITDMSGLFKDKEDFNYDISNWNVSNVINMSHMFSYAESFNQDISLWNVSNVKDMYSMFERTELFNQDITGMYLMLKI